jgi:hypothetical protein
MFRFSSLTLVFQLHCNRASGGGKPRIPSGIEGWAGFLPPATSAVRTSAYPFRCAAGCVPSGSIHFLFASAAGRKSSGCAFPPAPDSCKFSLESSTQSWGVVQSVGHLTVNEDGVGSSPTAPANSSIAKTSMFVRLYEAARRHLMSGHGGVEGMPSGKARAHYNPPAMKRITVAQFLFTALTRLFYTKGNRLKARVGIYAYNHHVRLLCPEPMVIEEPQSTRSEEPMLVCNH